MIIAFGLALSACCLLPGVYTTVTDSTNFKNECTMNNIINSLFTPSYINFIDWISAWEGGYQSYDSAGHTNRGVTIGTWQVLAPKYFGIAGTVETLKAMTEQQWRRIVKHFWDTATGGNKFKSQAVSEYATEFLWASGALQWVQRAVNDVADSAGVAKIPVDGVIGQTTVNAVNAIIDAGKEGALVDALNTQMLKMYQSSRDWSKYSVGWTRRANELYAREKKKLEVLRLATFYKETPKPLA